MKQTNGSRKNNEEIKQKISMILLTECSDPRLSMITVTAAKVSKDRSMCNVYVSSDPSRYDEVLDGLNKAKGRIRSLLGKNLRWKVTPELRFIIDETIDEAENIDKALLNVPPTMNIEKDDEGRPIEKNLQDEIDSDEDLEFDEEC